MQPIEVNGIRMASTPRFDRRLPMWFCIIAIFAGGGFALVNPPFNTPDELSHFARAWCVSVGQLGAEPCGASLGGEIPRSIVRLERDFRMISFDGASIHRLAAARTIPLEPQKTEFHAFANVAPYPFFPYVPQALGIGLARLFSSSVLVVMFCGRECNLLAYVLIVWVALKVVVEARARLVLALVALLPMSLYEAASLSADGFTIATAILTAAAFYRITFRQGFGSRVEQCLVIFSSVLLSLSKLVYCPFVLLAMMIPPSRFGSTRRYAGFVAAALGVNAAALVLWMWHFHGLPRINSDPAVNGGLQIRFILQHPGHLVPLLITTAHAWWYGIFRGMVGIFGWNEYPLPLAIIVISYLLLLAAIGIERPRLRRVVGVSLAVAVLGVLAIGAGDYIEWTPVGDSRIWGIQGRYFIPMLPLLVFLCAPDNRPKYGRAIFIVSALIAAFSVIFLAQTIYPGFPGGRYYYRYSGR
jgi:uncharacterized membrane protein